jgi:hypothetical protein
VHPQLDNPQRNAAANRLFLLGQVNHDKAAFANLLEQSVPVIPVN